MYVHRYINTSNVHTHTHEPERRVSGRQGGVSDTRTRTKLFACTYTCTYTRSLSKSSFSRPADIKMPKHASARFLLLVSQALVPACNPASREKPSCRKAAPRPASSRSSTQMARRHHISTRKNTWKPPNCTLLADDKASLFTRYRYIRGGLFDRSARKQTQKTREADRLHTKEH